MCTKNIALGTAEKLIKMRRMIYWKKFLFSYVKQTLSYILDFDKFLAYKRIDELYYSSFLEKHYEIFKINQPLINISIMK